MIEDDYLHVCINIPAESSIELIIFYNNMHQYEGETRSLTSDIKVSMRRYLSEFRDQYMQRNEVLLKQLYRVKKHLF